MNQGLSLERRGCARNSGVFILVRILLGTLVFLSLNTIFYVPGESMLTAAQSIKANVFFFIGVIAVLFFMSLFSLITPIPLNNVLTSVNEKLSKSAQILRHIEVLIFIAAMILLFAEVSFFYQVLLFGIIVFGLHLLIVGYLIFISGYLGRVLGISLIIGGSIGYLFESLTHTLAPDVIWLSTYGILFAIIAEVALAITLIIKAMQMDLESPDTKERVIRILERLGEATTSEIIDEASKESDECKDRVPKNLTLLENEEVVTKRLSREKKGYVWTLVS
ncbi:MAG: DUF4386 domain-containing protein [Candidatus Hodarchaeales archaeon]|jgi:hypothetical protein